MKLQTLTALVYLLSAIATTGCTTQSEMPMRTPATVDLERFMGKWYVIANIPTFFERNAVNPLEHYRLNDDGTVAITFTFNDGGPAGKERTLTMKGFPSSEPGIWGVQMIWPIKADYRIAHLDPDYEHSIIGRSKRDYLWIMSRSSKVSESKLSELLAIAAELGYDRNEIRLTSWQQSIVSAAKQISRLPR
jgi:apolipoprotein D and lipocalin family protein